MDCFQCQNKQTNKETVKEHLDTFKTTISCSESMCDENGQVIPNGNYYFTINKYNDTYCQGSLTSKGEYGDFVFKNIDVIKMMSIAQSRLARRAGLTEDGMPNYLSPPISPENKQLKQLNQEDVVYNYFYTPDQCSICLNMISQERQRLICNHSFHNDCIMKWLERDNRCPVCRKINPLKKPQTSKRRLSYPLHRQQQQQQQQQLQLQQSQSLTNIRNLNLRTIRSRLPSINLRRRYNNYIVPLNNYVDPTAYDNK